MLGKSLIAASSLEKQVSHFPFPETIACLVGNLVTRDDLFGPLTTGIGIELKTLSCPTA